ncbi:SDR family NAD(P)-dependent oxidoreductase [Saccharopolyspora sp. NPDC050389]|uniref:SDR family oxidoreductase n=1 Tax=Saccharopolyspora sp. NPDC050389 TaxID=3155516 RepID=UPI0033F7DA2B
MSNSHVSLVTGGSSGIGAALARRLLVQGRRVAVTGRDPGRLAELAAELDTPDLLTLVADAGDHAATAEAVAATVERFGRLDAVVANAGYALHDSVADGDPAAWDGMVRTNVLGPALLINAALPQLTRSRGRIVLVGSVAGMVHTPGNLYGATKWAVTGLAENTRRLVTADGVGVSLISPGRVDTAFWDPVGGAPAGGGLSAEQVADSIVWVLNQPEGVDVNTVTIRPLGAAV